MTDKSQKPPTASTQPSGGAAEQLQSPAAAYLAIKKAADRQVYPPGVVDGVLMDPKAYFFWLIQRAENMPADDWAEVLTTSGIPEGYPPGVTPQPNLVYGLTQQIGAGGVRGRLFLPTTTPDPLGYYAHPIDVLNGTDPNLTWAWKDAPGGPHPPYVPVNMPGAGGGPGSGGPAEPPPGGGGTTPPPSGLTEQQVQAMITAALKPYFKEDDSIAIQFNSGLFMGAKAGGPTKLDEEAVLLGKEEVHAWESYKLKRGE